MRVAGAVDIGGTTVKVGIVGEDGAVLDRMELPTSAGGEPAPLVTDIARGLPFID